MLANLKQVYINAEDFEAALSYSERILLLTPDAPLELRDRSGKRFFDPAVYEKALEGIESALALISAAYTPLA